MAQKVSNQKRTIATKGTKHKPRAVAPDVCKLPNNAPAPFDNWILSDQLQNGTIYTKIGKHPIWMCAAQIGPSSEPHHSGVNKGVVSGTYCAEARATSWSQDVFAEGKAVVRTNDSTTQNHGNTTGIVDGRRLGEAPPDPSAFVKLRCSIAELEGESEAEGDPGDKATSRKLGFPGGQKGQEPYYLEILEGKEVVFTSTRVDVTVEPEKKDPYCGRVGNKHTEWTWTRSGGSLPALAKGPFKGKKYTLSDTKTLLSVLAGSRADKDAKGPEGDQKDGTKEKFKPGKGRKGELNEGASVGGELSSSLAFINYWNSWNDPLIFEVTATACSGSKKAMIKAFPTPGIKLTLQFGESVVDQTYERVKDPIVTRIRKGMESVKSIFDVVKKVSAIAGHDFKFEMFVGASCGCEIAYIPCKKDKLGLYGTEYTQALVGRKWKLWFGASPLIKVFVSWPISLINFAAPCLGEGVASVLRKFGVKADLIFGFEFSLSITFSVGQDEYDYWTDTGDSAVIKLTPSIALEIAAGIKLITLKASWEHTGTLKFAGGDKKGVLLQMTLSVTAELEVKLTLFDDSWFATEAYDGKPEFGELKYLDKKYDLITL